MKLHCPVCGQTVEVRNLTREENLMFSDDKDYVYLGAFERHWVPQPPTHPMPMLSCSNDKAYAVLPKVKG